MYLSRALNLLEVICAFRPLPGFLVNDSLLSIFSIAREVVNFEIPGFKKYLHAVAKLFTKMSH